MKLIAEVLSKNKQEIGRALSTYSGGQEDARELDYFLRLVQTYFQQDKTLDKCTMESKVAAVHNCATLGLTPDSVFGDCYLIPYRQGNSKWECKFHLGYHGAIKLAKETGEVAKVNATCVYEGDELKIVKGFNETLEIIPSLSREGDDEITHVVAWVEMSNGSKYFECWTKEQVERHRKLYVRGQSSAWSKSWSSMAEKTMILRVLRFIPLGAKFTKAMSYEKKVEAEVINITPAQGTTAADRLSKSLKKSLADKANGAESVNGEKKRNGHSTEKMDGVRNEIFSLLLELQSSSVPEALKQAGVESTDSIGKLQSLETLTSIRDSISGYVEGTDHVDL